MDHKFYDVKKKEAVTTAITECKVYGEGNRVRHLRHMNRIYI